METMIQILASDVVDKIAAGEVIDRPAHLIKELVENSIDAGATEIDISFDHGGRSCTVRDNGKGMGASDLKLSVQRHATSKISRSEDLYNLHSFGFRGEALASIAAVSRLKITSRTTMVGLAHSLEVEFGQFKSLVESEAPVGTTVFISDLFESVPARLKFLKSDSAESAHIKSMIKSIGLANPQVQFRVRHHDQLLYFFEKTDLVSRAEAILEVKPLFLAESSGEIIKVKALWASPQQTLRLNKGISIFVQGRPVTDRAMTAAIMESYRNLLMHGEYPQVVLFIETDPSFVDVNVHPTKSQVKFQNSQAVFRAIVGTLRRAIEQAPWLKSQEQLTVATPQKLNPPEEQTSTSFEFFNRAPVQYREIEFDLGKTKSILRDSIPPVATEEAHWALMDVKGQLHQTYIVAESREGFFLIDQHAAHERVVFERLMMGFKNKTLARQPYLIPLSIRLSAHLIDELEPYFAQMKELGLSLERSGPESVSVCEKPSLLSDQAVTLAVEEIADQVSSNGGSFAWDRKVGDIFASLACHSVVRAGQTMSVEEMKELLVQMDEFPLSSFCPHGRPVSVKWTFPELERLFGRRI